LAKGERTATGGGDKARGSQGRAKTVKKEVFNLTHMKAELGKAGYDFFSINLFKHNSCLKSQWFRAT